MKTDVVKGASAGAVGVWAMDTVTWAVYRREDPATIRREKQVRAFGKDPAHALAQRLARRGGSDVAEIEPNAAGIAIHAGLGMAPGALYPALRRRLPWLRAGRGTVYGLALFVVNDEIAGRLLGIMGPQRGYPWRTHLRGLLGHVVLGVVTEMTLNVLEEQSSSQYEPREHQGEATDEQAA
ncbi:MAG: DUF1440 domain-containing protein [Actinomycetota bacterium]|nr:DUF1440 domain-containing protein [Actinomycetota bacterium]